LLYLVFKTENESDVPPKRPSTFKGLHSVISQLKSRSPLHDTFQNYIFQVPFYILVRINSVKLTNEFNAAKFLKIRLSLRRYRNLSQFLELEDALPVEKRTL
jgi:hypothetical protein